MYAFKLLDARGHPDEPYQEKGWRSKTAVANAVLDYLQKRSVKLGEEPPDTSTVRRKVPVWLKDWCAARK